MPDPDFGEAVAAVIVGKPGHCLTEAGVIGALRGEIAHFKVPKRVFFQDELPRNAMGKVQKAALREKLAAG
jgi:malonyl-CoA/methylmalonyl-CoA synthetase